MVVDLKGLDSLKIVFLQPHGFLVMSGFTSPIWSKSMAICDIVALSP